MTNTAMLDCTFSGKVKDMFNYDPDTGVLTWQENNLVNIRCKGKVVGKPRKNNGYLVFTKNHRLYQVSRVIWAYVHGKNPDFMIDHINGVTTDNRLENLRDVSNTVNQQNQRKPMSSNKSGFMGVCWHIRKKTWRVNLRYKGKTKHIGYFDDPQVGYQAYLSAKRELQEGCTI